MANEEHLKILIQGVESWNQWRREHEETPNLSVADLSSADLRGANLSGADLGVADLRVADLHAAYLYVADLRGADLSGANLSCANLTGTDLSDADLHGANLRGADLSGANLRGASLRGAKIRRAEAMGTAFADCDLSEVKELDLVQHNGPSTIGIDTIYKSKGKIPESFLRGCGVPESFIVQMRALVGAEDGIQFYSCFISYSGMDEEFARRLHGKMRDAHLRVWFAPEDMKGGEKLHEQIETAIRVYDKLLIVLSEHSLKSTWVMDELRKGFRDQHREGKRKLFPIGLTTFEKLGEWVCRDSMSGIDLAEEVRQYFIPDFSNWKDHDSFEAAFDRLLKDLRADEREK